MNDSPNTGLRERKRAKTAKAIHIAAVELVHERGLDAATIDAISERAEVSTRTFFNYFPSKEDALLGIDDAAVADELDRAPDRVEDVLTGVFDLLYTVFQASGGQHNKSELTRAVVQKHPQLITRQMLRITELEGRLSDIIAGWLATDPRFSADSAVERLDEAHVILGICLSTVRSTMRRWATRGENTDSAADEPREDYERSIATLRTVLEKLG